MKIKEVVMYEDTVGCIHGTKLEAVRSSTMARIYETCSDMKNWGRESVGLLVDNHEAILEALKDYKNSLK